MAPADAFVAIRLRGVFERIRYRVACKSEPGVDLLSRDPAAALAQAEGNPS